MTPFFRPHPSADGPGIRVRQCRLFVLRKLAADTAFARQP